ncbi:MAG: thioredoxin family protein [Pirellulaceae bacterium]|jgi:small redox-active disulfide protein 2|nr:thioredoxin family protein [Thermoguttaceae bacterium]MDI9444467.1 thioredoxin family protein [Planctomycetota bacterium]NLZ01354.1 thioredoxin family protein [Pirellulaceae bacterium]
MNVIHVLGAGCPRCLQLKNNAQAAAASAGVDCQVVEVSQIDEILQFGAMMTPALVVDGKLTIQGRIATVEEIAALLQ